MTMTTLMVETGVVCDDDNDDDNDDDDSDDDDDGVIFVFVAAIESDNDDDDCVNFAFNVSSRPPFYHPMRFNCHCICYRNR